MDRGMLAMMAMHMCPMCMLRCAQVSVQTAR